MLRILHDTKYDFIKHWKTVGHRHDRASSCSASCCSGSRGATRQALNYSIEFTGGTVMQLHFAADAATDAVRGDASTQAGFTGAEVTTVRQSTRLPHPGAAEAGDAAAANADSVGAQIVDVAQAAAARTIRRSVVRAEAVGPRVGAELQDEGDHARS